MEKLTLKQVRLMKGLTQKELGELLGLTEKAIHRREKGEVQWNLIEVYNLCEKLNIDPGLLNLKP